MHLRHCFLACLLSLALLLASCTRTEAPPAESTGPDIGKQVEELRAMRDGMGSFREARTALNAQWTMGETKSKVAGYYDGETQRLIDEEMDMGSFGSARSTYLYREDGTLGVYTEDKQSRGAGGKMEHIETELYFGPDGALLQGTRKVDGETTALTGFEEQGVKMHARELEAALAEARAKPKR